MSYHARFVSFVALSQHSSSNQSHSSAELQQGDPGAYPIPFRAPDVELGSRLDSIPTKVRYWAVGEGRAGAPWYNEMVQANNQYEEWLSTRPPGEYPVPFVEKRLDEINDGFRDWGIHPNRSSAPWYNFFVRAYARYKEHLAATQPPGEFPLPRGINSEYTGVPIKDVPQDSIWWALRPSNHHRYQSLYDANKRFLDDVYKSRSPGSEPIWFGTRYQGLRLDQVYERKGYIHWCLDPQRGESGWVYQLLISVFTTFYDFLLATKAGRLKDLVLRLEDWRRVHPERSGPRQRRKVPDIQNPVGEAIGPWDDSLGSADEEEYEKDGFVQSDEEIEYSLSSDELMSGGSADDNDNSSGDSDQSTSSNVELTPSLRHTRKRRRTNVILSGDEEEAGVSAGKLGKRYRVGYEEAEVPASKSSK